VKRLIEAGNEVVTFDVNDSLARLEMISDAGVVAKVNRRVGKIEDTAAVKALVKDEGITHICHLAAVLMPFCAKNPVEGALINVVGTLNVFEAAKEAGVQYCHIEQDLSHDPMASIQRSLAYLRS